MKITTSKLHTLLIAGESAAIEYKRCGEGSKKTGHWKIVKEEP